MGKVKEDLSLLLRKLDVEEQLKKAIKIVFEEILVVNHYVCMDVFDNIYIEEINKEFELDGDNKIRLKNDYEFFQVKFFSLCTKELSVTKARYIIFLFLNIKNNKNTYFSKKEYAEVICCLINDSNKYAYDEDYIYSTNAGNVTEDKIFLLSIDEANQYFSSDESRMCEYDGDACWWLRSPGFSQDGAAFVDYDGSVDSGGHNVDSSSPAVRPALWINLES